MKFSGVYPHYLTKAEVDEIVCKIRVEEIEDSLIKKVRYLDKLIYELAKGKKMEKIFRK